MSRLIEEFEGKSQEEIYAAVLQRTKELDKLRRSQGHYYRKDTLARERAELQSLLTKPHIAWERPNEKEA